MRKSTRSRSLPEALVAIAIAVSFTFSDSSISFPAGRDSGLILFICAEIAITDGRGVVRLGITFRPYD